MKSLALILLRSYKRWISPAFPPSCRYVPTCSQYALEAVDRYGAVRGVVMALWRVLRCHPFAKDGLDPVVKKSAVNPAHPQMARMSASPGADMGYYGPSLRWTDSTSLRADSERVRSQVSSD